MFKIINYDWFRVYAHAMPTQVLPFSPLKFIWELTIRQSQSSSCLLFHCTSRVSMSSPLFPPYFRLISDPFHSIFFGFTGTMSIVTNLLLLYALFVAKNAEIGHYRQLLVCFALCDMATSTMHFVALPVIFIDICLCLNSV